MPTNRNLAIALSLCLVFAAAGCHELPVPSEPAGIVTATIDASCEVTFSSDELQPGDLVRICNTGTCPAVWIFEDGLFATNSVRLHPGACTTRRVLKGAANRVFATDLDCECDRGGGHSTPEIRVGNPPPPTP